MSNRPSPTPHLSLQTPAPATWAPLSRMRYETQGAEKALIKLGDGTFLCYGCGSRMVAGKDRYRCDVLRCRGGSGYGSGCAANRFNWNLDGTFITEDQYHEHKVSFASSLVPDWELKQLMRLDYRGADKLSRGEAKSLINQLEREKAMDRPPKGGRSRVYPRWPKPFLHGARQQLLTEEVDPAGSTARQRDEADREGAGPSDSKYPAPS